MSGTDGREADECDKIKRLYTFRLLENTWKSISYTLYNVNRPCLSLPHKNPYCPKAIEVEISQPECKSEEYNQ
jgi:hypothetical protein